VLKDESSSLVGRNRKLEQTTPKESSFATWVVIVLLLALILVKGFFAFFAVGDRGQPTWDYRPVQDVPGESPYAVYEPLPYPQHVRGQKGE
jgi:hypothetical protein